MTTIVLPKEALDVLFPEGTEARVELQKSALEQFVKQYIKTPTIGKDVRRYLDDSKAEIIARAVKEAGIADKGNWYPPNIILSQPIQDKIKQAVDAAINHTIQTTIESLVSPDLIEDVAQKYIDKQVDDAVRLALQKNINAMTQLVAKLGKN